MNLGWTEILLIGGIALLLFGPSKLPNLGRSLGEAIRGFKKRNQRRPSGGCSRSEQSNRAESGKAIKSRAGREGKDEQAFVVIPLSD